MIPQNQNKESLPMNLNYILGFRDSHKFLNHILSEGTTI